MWLNRVDRLDSTGLYCVCDGKHNMVPCCSACNACKGALPAPQFILHCINVAEHSSEPDRRVGLTPFSIIPHDADNS